MELPHSHSNTFDFSTFLTTVSSPKKPPKKKSKAKALDDFFTNLLLIQHIPHILGVEPAHHLIKQFAYGGELYRFDMEKARQFYTVFSPIIRTIHNRNYSYKYIWVKNEEDELFDLEDDEDDMMDTEIYDVFDIGYDENIDFEHIFAEESEYSEYKYYCNASHWSYSFFGKKEKHIQLQAVNCFSCSNYIITNTPHHNYPHFPLCRCRNYDIVDYIDNDDMSEI